jgi:hypothetical protein
MSDPVIVNPSVGGTQALAALRQLLLVFGGAALGRYLSKEQIDFLLSNEFVQLIALGGGVVAAVWGQIKVRTMKKTLVDAANAAPDSKFKVESK